MGGDFNVVKNDSERKGRAMMVNLREGELFSDFIHKSSLVDILCKGKKFTWFSEDGESNSRIDRFFMSSIVVNRWEVIGQITGERDISDHCHICIMTNNANWGPKLFRFNSEWFSFNSVIPFVEKEWKSMEVEGR